MSQGTIPVAIRTPGGLTFEGPATGIRAEDDDGWFGIWPRRSPLLASLPPGLAILGSGPDEHFVAHSGGLLRWDAHECRVILEEAVVADELKEIAQALAAAYAKRRARASHQRGVLHDLEREALRRLMKDVTA